MKRNHTDMYHQIGLNIAFYRKARGLSQIQLVELTGYSRTHISRLETAEQVSLDSILTIAEALEIDPAKLLENRL